MGLECVWNCPLIKFFACRARTRAKGILPGTQPSPRTGKPNHNSILHRAGCKCIFNEANARAPRRQTTGRARPGKRKYYGLFNISHTSRCTCPQAACLLDAFYHRRRVALLQNHFANPSTCQVTGLRCPAPSVAAFIAVAFHLLEMQKGTRVAGGGGEG